MADKLFATNDRDESHRFLAAVRGSGLAGAESAAFTAALAACRLPILRAECREDPNATDGRYQVWSDSNAR